MEKFNENLKVFLLSILIVGWGVDCSQSFENFPGFRGEGGTFPRFPPLEPLLLVYVIIWEWLSSLTICFTVVHNLKVTIINGTQWILILKPGNIMFGRCSLSECCRRTRRALGSIGPIHTGCRKILCFRTVIYGICPFSSSSTK